MLSKIITQIKTSNNEELSQSLVRIALVIIVSLYLFGYYLVFPEKEILPTGITPKFKLLKLIC